MRHLARLGHSLAAGAVTGAALAPLQLLLWAEVSLSPGRALLALAAWASWAGLWLGLICFLVLELLALAPPRLLGGPGFSVGLWRRLMAVASLLVAAVAVWNRHLTRDLLVPANREALSVAAWIAGTYLLVLLVLIVRRAVPRLAAVITLSGTGLVVALLWGVWLLTPPAPPPQGGDDGPPFKAAHRLLMVSWEGADLPWLLPLLEHKDMPFLQSRRDRGAWGQLRTVRPYTRSAALATLATGCAPSVHGVLGRRSYRLSWLLDQPVTLLLAGPWPSPHQLPWRAWERVAGASPRRAPIWSIVERSGLPAGNAGWPRWSTGGWDLQAPLASETAPFEEFDADLRAALAPALAARPDAARDAQRAFAVASELHAAVLRRGAAERVEALVVNTRLVAQLRPAWTPQGPGDPADDTLRQAARLLDDELRRLWQLLGGEDTLLVVASPYGMAPPSPWRRLGRLVGRASEWQVSPDEAPDGFVLFSGPGTRAGERLRTRRVADVVPTILYLLELPVARDMAGGVILEAVSDDHAARVPLRRVASYAAAGPPGQR
ncbi:MAG TPA: alkaline phosphatase family protein [Thermoanaerobaculaceae bacterium]|nr:alkaline phosphatase family protein [Thermoanaerobaculaceae bacterium]HRS15869.1 alkaline phosphatase family protein [Thermoanaerobaculaceae bacterium]